MKNLEKRYLQTLEKTKSLTANNQFDDFVSEQYLQKNKYVQKKKQKRLVYSANKTGTKNSSNVTRNTTEKFLPYEDSNQTIPRRRINTGQMLSTLK